MEKHSTFHYEITKDNSLIVYDPVFKDQNDKIMPYRINEPYASLFLTTEMQRLKYIGQCGENAVLHPQLIYNTRFLHCVETFHIMELLLNRIDQQLPNGQKIPKDVRMLALTAMGIHDIGHGPGSHLYEFLTGSNHEQRVIEILESEKTEIHQTLFKMFDANSIKLLEDIITENVTDDDIEKNRYIKLISQLASSEVDADKLAYLSSDAYYAGFRIPFNLSEVINSIDVTIDKNGNYMPTILEDKLSSVELMRNFRAQMYRDLYFSDKSQILMYYYKRILELYKNDSSLDSSKIPWQFDMLAKFPQNINIEDFLQMTDISMIEAMSIIRKSSKNPLLRYLCDCTKVVNDCISFRTRKNKQKTVEELSNSLGMEISNTDALVPLKTLIKVRKKKEAFYIDSKNEIVSSNSDNSNVLFKPQKDKVLIRRLIFNPEILRLELGLSVEEFNKYLPRLAEFTEKQIGKSAEFKLKYVTDQTSKLPSSENVLEQLTKNGWDLVQERVSENEDSYYDTKDLDLLKAGHTVKVRRAKGSNGKEQYILKQKKHSDYGNSIYSSGDVLEKEFNAPPTIEEVSAELSKNNLNDNILNKPLLNAAIHRKDFIMQKDGFTIRLAFDSTHYQSYAITGAPTADSNLLQIDVFGNAKNRIVLNQINDILGQKFTSLVPTSESTYKLGIAKLRESQEKEKAVLEEDYCR